MIRMLIEGDADRLPMLRDALLAHGYDVDEEHGADIVVKARLRDGLTPLRAPASLGEERYRKLFEYAPDGIVIADNQSYYLDANPAICRMLGFTHKELVGRHATDIVASTEVSNIEPALQVIATHGDYHQRWLFKRKDGSVFPADVMATTLPDGNLLGMIRDVSDLAAADSRIRDLNRTYSVLSDINQLIVREHDAAAIIQRACRIAVEKGNFLLAWIGMKDAAGTLRLAAHAGADDATLRVVSDILDAPHIGCAFTARALQSGEPALCNDIETDPLSESWRTAALQRGYRAMASFPLIVNEQRLGTFNLYADRTHFFDDDEVRLLAELAGDISFALTMSERERERREFEQRLAQAQKLQAIGTLAGGIAHDFNNVLTAIAGNADLARVELQASHPALTCIAEIDRAAQRAKQLVQRILTFSRPYEHTLKPILLTPVLEEAVRLLRSTLPARVDLQLHASANLPTVLADESQIHQVILNLATNAWHALQGKHGRIDIDLSACQIDAALAERHTDLSPGPYARISVTDNGMGMSDAVMQRLYEPFFTTKPPGEGTGLGLSVVHGIVHGHHGAILVESEVNRGSTFHVYLPACAEQPTLTQRSDGGATATPAGGERILYIDDEDPLVYLAVRFLKKMGYHVAGFTQPAEALRAFRAAPDSFDLVITDQNMPQMTGLEVAEQILRIRPGMPLLLTSGYMRPEETDAARALGVRHIVLKPDSVTQFGPLVRRLLTERE